MTDDKPSVWWQFGSLVIVRHGDEEFELFYRGMSVMPPADFDVVCRYVWTEFLDE